MSGKGRDWLVEAAGLVRRTVEGVMPGPDGEAPPVVRTGRILLAWLMATLAGFVLGGAVGLLLVLVREQWPDAAPVLLGLVVGVAVGCALSVGAAAAVAFARRKKRGFLLLIPVVALAAPFLLLGAAWKRVAGRKGKR
jgi:hypothetical protein